MIQDINHIGIAVKSIKESLPFYQQVLGLKLEGIEEVESQQVKVAFLLAGNTRLELLEGTSDTSPISRFIDKKGEGIHHIALSVHNIEDRIAELHIKGINMIDNQPRIGAHGASIAFMHPKSTGGVLYELCERDFEGDKG
ncbi:methylmalonyl-CoA/ethylmalonyl-CoA epimerase [Peribacillus deserti]|uniref:Methylmalonyl-CoA/ethylmalonyl-CoA epimerase n=1 Tax=Peribacillus deserti TaxID=673318 RepID=A0ABS2QJU3_9BACI|nr:methylmalonyl-CoA epimerase [Peribacillus deserti]MBM7693220.1 methylmalonyl-CoA/ethylmalonyl-CoA epimerase [Peribacillus deserti]